MKRFTAAAVAAATALSLSIAPATAAEKGSSEVSEGEVFGYILKQGLKEAVGGDGYASSVNYGIEKGAEAISSKGSSTPEEIKEGLETAGSAKEYPVGTTAEILVGTSIAAIVLGLIAGVVNAVNSGLIKVPGFNA
ncbi:hypothetical protein [Corynebacterium aurimucosum]|uniref:Putative membrane protein n=1 Tax=Corynebacterium aurimucosum (strain ATCC 700975 / DSM 44827 / CIP 107346 / CN-1) TaxID=548476 RepID=C3PJ51_CORA7|nr:hypothetical protein [Corynebacterium aurimucosum]ACP31709.1 putative membrane protein [Corynebacterium aurimucosum ATCC 700975]QQU94070.1 hypothetical protein I6I67_05235 [Corynebacterium aurimucosum]